MTEATDFFARWALPIVGSALLFAFMSLVQKRRTQIAENPVTELKPNCLLTRHPVIFLEGPSSLFYLGNYWNQIPEYLAAHGYEVHQVQGAELSKWLHNCEERHFEHHLIVDASFSSSVNDVLSQRLFTSLRSLTVVCSNQHPSQDQKGWLKPLRNSCEDLIIDTQVPSKNREPFWSRLHWSLHRFLNSKALRDPKILGWTADPVERLRLHQLFLDRCVELAERDLTSLSTQPSARTNHEPTESRPSRDSEFAPHLSQTPRP